MDQSMKPAPAPDADSEPFWSGCREHRLRIQKCDNCGARRFPPHRLCPVCHSDRSTWIDASGRGKVYSWITVVHPVPKDVYQGDVPYVVALIDLEEGVRMVSNIIGIDPHAITAEMPVQVVFEPGAAGFVLPKFKPAT